MADEEKSGNQESAPELSLDLDDKKLAFFIESYEKRYDEFLTKKKIKERRDRNVKYLFGKQLDDQELKTYEKKYIDNVIKESEDVLRTLVLSRLPDILVNPGSDSQVPQETAELVGDAVNKTLHSDELKKILTKAFRRHPLDYTAVIKYFWNPNKGKMGDVDWEVIPAKYIKIDTSATDNDEESMRLIVHEVNKTLSDWIMLFPDKEDILKEVAGKNGWKSSNDEDGIAFDLRIQEVWFEWKEKADEFDPENPEFKVESGVLWKAGKGDESILDKRRNPNWDWEGEEELFFNGQPIPEEALSQILLMGVDVPGIERKKVFRNYFSRPKKPFIFMGYEQYGEMAFDETSRIEENRLLQDNYDKRGMQITKMIDDARGKHVFSSVSGLKKETVEAMDLNDPDEDLFLDGELKNAHDFITKEQPSAQMFNDLVRTEQRMKEKLHIAGAASGDITSDTATTTQIQRESSFTVADDIADLTINEVATKMAEALLHMMKLRYTPEHFQRLVGTQGEDVHTRITQDVIEDGMEITIKASGTDKLRRERMAKEEAQLGLIDPISYYKDTGRDDPELRAEMAFMFNNAPELYFKKFIENKELGDVAAEVMMQNRQNLQQAQGQVNQAPMRPSPAQPGQIPETPQGSPRGLIGRATNAVGQLFNR